MLYDYKGDPIPGVNIKSLGVYGDGTHDDSDAINSALTQHEILYVPSGTYIVKKTIVVPDGCVIYGNGDSTVFKLLSPFSLTSYPWRDESRHYTKYPIFYVGANCRLKDFVIEGDTTAAVDQGQVGIMIHDDNVCLENVSTNNINYFPNDWIPDSSGGGYGENDACPGFGVFIFNADHVSIIGGSFTNNGYQAIGTENASDIVLDGCYVGEGLRTGIQLHRNTKRAKIINCTVVNSKTGITMHGMPNTNVVDDVVINGCIINTQSNTGGIFTVFGFEQNMVISACKIKSGAKGIFINQNPNEQWVDNRLAANHIVIADNVINTPGDGVVINGDKCIVSDNIIECGGTDVIIAGTSKVVSDNLVLVAN